MEEISSAAFSTEKEQSLQWRVATIEVAEQGFEAPPVADEARRKPGEQRMLSNGREDSSLLRT